MYSVVRILCYFRVSYPLPLILEITNTTDPPALFYLGEEVELDHGIGEGVGIGAEVGNHAQHGAIEGPVDLLEARLTRVVHVHHGHVPQKPARRPLDNTCCKYLVANAILFYFYFTDSY